MTKHHLVLFVLAVAPRAFAQPASSAAQAEALFNRGKELLAANKIPEACASFDASQKLDPTLTTRLNQANCREKNGQLATAWGHFLEAEREARTLGTPDAKQLQTVASTRAAALEKRVSTLQINLSPDVVTRPGLEVWRNRDAVEVASLNAPLPIDGGTYTITVRLPRSREWTTTVAIANEKDVKSVEVPVLVEETPARDRSTTPKPTSPTHHAERTPPRTELPPPSRDVIVQPTLGPLRYVAIGTGVLGLAAIAFGAQRGFAANRKQSDAQALCPDPRVPCENATAATQLTYDGHDLATQANLTFAIGGGLVAVGIALWFVGKPAPHASSEVTIAPSVSADGATVTISGAW